jgi:hypothetical protein
LISLEICNNLCTRNLVAATRLRLRALLIAAMKADLLVESSEQMRSG